MTAENLQFIAYEFQRQNYKVYTNHQGNVVELSKGIDQGASPNGEAEILIKKDGQVDNIREGRWLQIKYKEYPNGKQKFNIDVHEDGVSQNGEIIDSVEVEPGQDDLSDAREQVFRKAKSLI